MNILMLSMSMGAGGAETHVLTLASALVRAGHRVTVASEGGMLTRGLEEGGVAHVTLPLASRSPIALTRAVGGIVRLCRRERFDVIHAHGRIPALAAHAARRLSPRVPPCAVTVHGVYSPHAPGARLSKWGERTMAVSDDIADYTAATYGIDRGRIAVIPNGVDIPPKAADVRRAGLDIVTSGRLDGDSSAAALMLTEVFPTVCREFESERPTLTIIGGGTLEGEIRARAERVNRAVGRAAVICTGAVPDAAAEAARHSIFVGSSRASIEAMAAGMPVLLCGNAGVRGILTGKNFHDAAADNLTCRCAPRTNNPVAALLDGIRRLARMSAEERAALGEFCRRTAREHYDIDRTAANTAAVLSDTAREARPDILICGYYGAGNAGDDASLAAVAGRLAAHDPTARLTATVRGKCAGGIPAGVWTVRTLREIKNELKKSRLLVFGGGSLLQDATSLRSLIFYAWVLRTAERTGCPSVIWGGVGPLTTRTARRIAARAVRRTDAVYARDRAAAAECLSLGARRVIPARDPAAGTRSEDIPPELGKTLPQGRYIAFFPRSIAALRRPGGKRTGRKADDALFSALTGAAQLLADGPADGPVDGLAAVPVFAAMSPDDDAVCRRMADATGGYCVPAGTLTPGGLVTLAAGSDAVIAVRLHAAVFAYSAGVPTVIVDHDPKTAGFAADAHIPALPADGLTADMIADAVMKARK